MEELLKLLRRYAAGGEVSEADRAKFTQLLGQIENPQQLREFIDQSRGVLNLPEDVPLGDMFQQIGSIIGVMDAQKAQQLAAQAKEQNAANAIQTGANILLGLSDIAQSNKQIRMSDKLLQRLKETAPQRPARLRPSPVLRNAIADAQTDRISDAPMAVAREQLREGYQNDLATARQASGGQAGAYAAMAQAASNRRRRGVNELLPMMAQLRQQQAGRLDNLAGLDMQERRGINASEQDLYRTDRFYHNQAEQAAGRLGATGRANRRNALYNMADNLPSLARGASNLFNSFQPSVNLNTYPVSGNNPNDLSSDFMFGDPDLDMYNEDVTKNLMYNNPYSNPSWH